MRQPTGCQGELLLTPTAPLGNPPTTDEHRRPAMDTERRTADSVFVCGHRYSLSLSGERVTDGRLERVRDLMRERFGNATEVPRSAPLAGDASTRRYVRIWLRGPSAPQTAVVMLLA